MLLETTRKACLLGYQSRTRSWKTSLLGLLKGRTLAGKAGLRRETSLRKIRLLKTLILSGIAGLHRVLIPRLALSPLRHCESKGRE